jgi:hypothetical protein
VAAMGPSDEQAAAALNARIYRVSDDGAVALSGGQDGWSLG